MKITYERILFMGIGALIAFCAYLIGNNDNGISAREYEDPDLGHVVECDTLMVNDRIFVGADSDETGNILLKADKNFAAIQIRNETAGGIILVADDKEVANKIFYSDTGDTFNPDSYVMVGATEKGALMNANSNKLVSVGLSYKKLNEILMNINKDEAGISIKDDNGVKLLNAD